MVLSMDLLPVAAQAAKRHHGTSVLLAGGQVGGWLQRLLETARPAGYGLNAGGDGLCSTRTLQSKQRATY